MNCSQAHTPTSGNDRCAAAVLTPAGRGALASVAVFGPNALAVVDRLFRPASGPLLSAFPLGRIVFGRWLSHPIDPEHQNSDPGRPGEELVVCGRSQRWVEIHCHGGSAAVEAILNSLAAAGVPQVASDDWVAFQEPDPLMADARVALARARTVRSAAVLLDQYRGALSRAVARAIHRVTQQDVPAARATLVELLRWAPWGQRLCSGWRLVVAGRTNVGKSRLVNALLGFQRALVCDEAGTTRDVLAAATAVNGWPVDLFDTAGSLSPSDEIEAKSMAHAARCVATADLVLLVSDASRDWSDEDEQWFRANEQKTLLIHNKSDLIAATPCDRPNGLLTSALKGDGIPALWEAVANRLIPTAPPPMTAVPFRKYHQQQLAQAVQALDEDENARSVSILRGLLEARTDPPQNS